MAHIAIEGMDGVGKTTTCKLLAERLGYKFIEKNLRFLFDENDEFDNYFKIVLDFFAGSGTTGHAVMDLNKEDGGNRKFILITNNESNICRKVTIPRIQKAIERFGFDEEIEIR